MQDPGEFIVSDSHVGSHGAGAFRNFDVVRGGAGSYGAQLGGEPLTHRVRGSSWLQQVWTPNVVGRARDGRIGEQFASPFEGALLSRHLVGDAGSDGAWEEVLIRSGRHPLVVDRNPGQDGTRRSSWLDQFWRPNFVVARTRTWILVDEGELDPHGVLVSEKLPIGLQPFFDEVGGRAGSDEGLIFDLWLESHRVLGLDVVGDSMQGSSNQRR